MKPDFTSPSWIEIIKYLYKVRIPLFAIPFAVAILVALYSLTIPNRYTSVANLVPSLRPEIGLNLFSEKGGLSSLANSVLGGAQSEEANRYLILLNSYTLSSQVVETFDLIEHYDVADSKTPMLDAIEILSDRTSFESKEEGNFVIAVEDESPELAKAIADFYVEQLNAENARLATTDARLYRQFLEKRIEEANAVLDSLRLETIQFQQQYGVFELTEQARQYFSLIAELSTKQIEAEIKLNIVAQNHQPNSNTYTLAKLELEMINQKLEQLYHDSDNTNLMLNFEELPAVGSRYLELLLAAEIQAEIQKFLVPVYEQAKMEEAKSLPIVNVVDAPRIPEEKSFPRRSLLVLGAGFSAFILVILYFIMRLNYIKNKDLFIYLKH